ncbi:pimeloyl-ACP methyl ester carboxylesterase [Paucibacter oligotrophus]|uniref:Pimeloyl-ACP methyl ester carboxylesterase n=1 Tax=Roseateles oligotrophus TaxID=1769250 RepID=A0A840L9V8_9BURK|nr:alpha/beta hydrolase [Roseateles oligotrophus]MBB4844960.1 pimeloyl-ACP methyl ester carboxylesterase [Roseateles oligotrophus]
MEFNVKGAQAYAYTGGKPFDPALPCLVFVHGALHDHSVWTLLARWFAHHGHSVLAVDLPGHGRSAGPLPTDVQSLGAWLLDLLSAAGVQQASLVGHSMGSLIALEAAAQAPERVRRLAMVGTAYPMKVSEALLSMARHEPLKAIDMVNNFSISSWASKPGYPGPGAWLHGGNRALMQRIQAGQTGLNLFEHDFRVCDAYDQGLEAAAKLQCPVSLLLGQHDQMTAPKQSQALAAALKAKTYLLPAGHSLMAEAPEQLLAALRQALA